jgi:energy-converting hydrogenase Eha subunit A
MLRYNKMALSYQAIVLMLCNFIIFMLMFINVFIPKKNKDSPSKTAITLVLLFIILPVMALQVYSLNCMVTGECHAWSWILSAIAGIFTILYVIGFVAMIIKLKKIAGPSSIEQN